jgi:TnpA family transposase
LEQQTELQATEIMTDTGAYTDMIFGLFGCWDIASDSFRKQSKRPENIFVSRWSGPKRVTVYLTRHRRRLGCPRIADIGGARHWRIEAAADYGLLNRVARHTINAKLIEENRCDVLRLAGSLKLGVVQATAVMRTLQIGDRPTKLVVSTKLFTLWHSLTTRANVAARSRN